MSRCGFTTVGEYLEASNMLPDYSKEQFTKDFDVLLEEGLITVSGINNQGEWLYEITEKGHLVWQLMRDSESKT